jgi:hypothetical protein
LKFFYSTITRHSYFRNRNSQLASHSLVNYLEFDFNIGRSKIRKPFADVAKGQWLLFLDCDVMVDDPNYLKSYIDNLHYAKVICGGRKYGPKPSDRNYSSDGSMG